jgi:hypothetical protein
MRRKRGESWVQKKREEDETASERGDWGRAVNRSDDGKRQREEWRVRTYMATYIMMIAMMIDAGVLVIEISSGCTFIW